MFLHFYIHSLSVHVQYSMTIPLTNLRHFVEVYLNKNRKLILHITRENEKNVDKFQICIMMSFTAHCVV